MWGELADLVVSGLASIFGGGSEYVGDLPLATDGSEYVGDLPLATDFYTGPSALMDGYQGTVGNFQAGNGADGGMGGWNNGAGGSMPSLGSLPRGFGDLFTEALAANLARPGGGGGGSVSMPHGSSGAGAGILPAIGVPNIQTGAVPSTPPGDAKFTPMGGGGGSTGAPVDLGGLARLFAARQNTDPFAEARALNAPRGVA